MILGFLFLFKSTAGKSSPKFCVHRERNRRAKHWALLKVILHCYYLYVGLSPLAYLFSLEANILSSLLMPEFSKPSREWAIQGDGSLSFSIQTFT